MQMASSGSRGIRHDILAPVGFRCAQPNLSVIFLLTLVLFLWRGKAMRGWIGLVFSDVGFRGAKPNPLMLEMPGHDDSGVTDRNIQPDYKCTSISGNWLYNDYDL